MYKKQIDIFLKNEIEKYYEECKKLRSELLSRFPKDKLKNITLDEYCIGDVENNSFCYYMEFKLSNLGKFFAGIFLFL